jgi:DNA-binding transcriptional LysR family regulator
VDPKIDLNELAMFARVAARQSFRVAASDLGVPSSTVSRKVASLEARLGVQLLERTTRSVRLTELGSVYQSHCERVLAAAEEGERTVRRLEKSPRGLLRLTAPYAFGEAFLGALLDRYAEACPAVVVELRLTDELLDMKGEGVDVAFRFGDGGDPSLLARSLGDARMRLCASPGYLARHPAPRGVEELAGHSLLMFGRVRSPAPLRVERDGKLETVVLSPSVAINSYPLLRGLCVRGRGLALMPAFYADEPLRRGELVAVLPELALAAARILVVRRGGVRPARSVQVFLDIVREHFDRHGWDAGAG